MPSLMTIPRELRDQICTYALFAPTNDKPALDQSFQELVESRCQYKKPSLSSWCKLVFGAPEIVVSNSVSLLLVSHQLHAETLENITLIQKTISYDLDVIVLEGFLPLTTWTCVPFLTRAVEEVNVNFRILGSSEDAPQGKSGKHYRYGYYRDFQGVYSVGPAIGWQIYGILERLIKYGPTQERASEHEQKDITIKTIDINVETLSGVDLERFCNLHHFDHFDYLGSVIERDISELLGGGRYEWLEWFDHGKILYEHVDRVVLSKGGDVFQSFDVAEMLNNAQGDHNHLAPNKLSQQKEMIWSLREKRGLKVLSE